MNLKKIVFGIALLICALSFSQSGINYKALIKDDNGNVLSSSPVSIQFIIYEGAALTNNVYQESHTINTDANGFVIVNIGEGTTSDDFNTINWSNGEHFLNVQVNTGSGLVDLGTTAFTTVPYAKVAENVNGLEAIDEGNGIGWRLVDKNPDFYGNIGVNAVDLSSSGDNVPVTGASGVTSIAMGLKTIAFGPVSTAMGNFTYASGFSSTAMGNLTYASGISSTAMGSNTIASGNSSTAMGLGANADAFASIAIGGYNIGGGNATQWIDSDPLFEIGNGTSSGNRSNALTVYKNGRHDINSAALGLRIDADDVGLLVRSESTGLNIYSAQNYGATIVGQSVGAYVSSSINGSPDIMLGVRIADGLLDDNGLIASHSSYSSSDMIFRSNDDLAVQLDYDNDEAGEFRISNGSSQVVLSVDESGNLDMDGRLQIGDETIEDTGSNQLTFGASVVPSNNNAYRLGNSSSRWIGVWATDGTINTSDRREKKNIRALDYGLAEVLKMKPVSFNWKDKNIPDTKLGLIAQELQDLVPEVVKSHIWEKDETTEQLSKKELDRLGVYYSDLVPVLIKAIQEQQNTIENLKSTIQNNKNTIQNQNQLSTKQSKVLEALLSRVDALEQSNN